MSFFEDIEGLSILERNSHRIEGMEMREATRLMKQFKEAREEIKNRLLFTPTNSFTEAHLQNALVQIEDMLRQLKMKITPGTQQAFSWFTEQGIEDGVRELNSMEKKFTGVSSALPIDVIIESTDPANLLLNNYQSSIDNYSQNLRTKIQSSLTQSLIQNQSWTQAVNEMAGMFTVNEWELARIVRTELHSVYNVSKNNGFGTVKEEYLPDLKKTLYHPMDSRTGDDSRYASMLKSMIVDIDDPFIYDWKGKTRIFMTPPDRPNDRAILIPYRAEWDS